MLWESKAKTAVQACIESAMQAARQEWEDDVIELCSFYEGDHKSYMTGENPVRRRRIKKAYLAQYVPKLWATQALEPVFVPILRRFIELRATLFHRAPSYRFFVRKGKGQDKAETDGAARDNAVALLNRVNFVQVGKTSQHNAQLAGVVFAMPRVYRGKIQIDVITPEKIYVQEDPLNPGSFEDCLAVGYRLPGRADTLIPDPDHWLIWTRESGPQGDVWPVYYLDANGNTLPNPYYPDNINPLGRFPMVPLYASADHATIFPVLDDSLIATQVSVDVAWTIINHCQHLSPGIMVITDQYDPNQPLEIPFCPGSTIQVPIGSTVQWLEAKLNLTEQISSIQSQLKLQAALHGLPPEAFDTEEKGKMIDALSAASKELDRMDLIEIREDQEPLWEKQIADLFSLLVQVYNLHQPNNPQWGDRIDPATELEVIWAQPEIPQERQSAAQADDFEYKWGSKSPVDTIMERDKCPRTEALEIFQRNLAERARAQEPVNASGNENQTAGPEEPGQTPA